MPQAPEAGAVAAPPGPPRLKRIAAVISVAAGGGGPGAAAEVAEVVAAHGCELALFTPAPGEVELAVRSAVDTAPDLVLILAGDGTARLAAELCGPDGPLVAPLPGGTLNMLPHALYGALPWRAALAETLEHGVERQVCGGRVGGRAFYVAAILGAPALWGHAREAARAGDFLEAGRRISYALRRAFAGELHYGLDGRDRRDAEALVLISPVVSKAMEGEAALETAALGVRSAQEVFRLAFTGLVGDWRRDPGVTVETCLRGWAAARRSIPAILDGEVQRLPRRVEFEYTPRAFRALAPLVPPRPSL
jgi:diacylglycerol kinase family enzyme